MNKLNEYFKNVNEISHAFLIGNVVFDEIKDEISDIINNKILNSSLNILNNPDIYYYDQKESLITKDEIKNLLSNISITSQFNKAKIYIINGVEKLSDTVYNAILKTLEEPKENIYAFLITKNIDAVKPTIKSRCQNIFLNSDTNEELFDNKLISLADKLIDCIEEKNINTIAINSEIYNEIDDREKFKEILKIILNKYDDNLNKIIKNEKYLENKQNNDIITLSKRLLVVDKFINLLDNYVNKNLIIDRFIIEMWRCNT